MRWRHGLVCVAAAVGLAACGGGGDDDNGTGPDNNLASVAVTAASSSINVGQTTALTATGRNAAGTTLSGVTFTYSSSSTAIATVSAAGVVTGVSAGSATITASGVLGAVTRTGTVTIAVTNPGPPPLTASVSMGASSFTPANVTLARTGTVTFTNGSGVQHNVTFDAVTGAPSNIGNHSSGSNDRQFNTAGQFPFNCTLHAGMSGRVTVQ